MAQRDQQDGFSSAFNKITITTSAAAAAARVFAIPELVEKILEHASPASLHGLRRVNTTFNDTINLRKFPQPMLLAPLGRLSIMRLIRVLHSPQVQRAIAPFIIGNVHIRPGGRDLVVNVVRGITTGVPSNGQSPRLYQKPGSWRQMKLEHGAKPLAVLSMDRRRNLASNGVVIKEWTSAAEVTLGDVVDAIIEKI